MTKVLLRCFVNIQKTFPVVYVPKIAKFVSSNDPLNVLLADYTEKRNGTQATGRYETRFAESQRVPSKSAVESGRSEITVLIFH